jgi:hypothetical protein
LSTVTCLPLSAGREGAAPSRPAEAPPLRPATGASSAVRASLIRYTGTLLPLVAALVALQLGGLLLVDSADTLAGGWPVAVVVAAGWALAVAVWLRHRGWTTATLVTAVAAPVAVLALPAAVGWLSPAGLLLWGPVSTVLAVLAVALPPTAVSLPPARTRSTAPATGACGGGRC